MTCTNQKTLYLPVRGVETPVSVPCGKCIPCLMNKRSEWSFRLQQEHRVSSSAHFVTLTYDEKHMRTSRSLNKRDLQLYLKRLRKKDEQSRIRYYAVGEYGSKFGRPHYHLLLFNSTEENIRGAWTDSNFKPIGLVHTGKVTEASIAYVTKYCIQKGEYPDGVEKPFATMSRRYGIGGHYLSDEQVQWHRDDDKNYTLCPGMVKGRLPRFYRDKIWYPGPDRERVSAAAMNLTLTKQKKEREYYQKKHGANWEKVMLHSRDVMLSRVKQKIKFSQKM